VRVGRPFRGPKLLVDTMACPSSTLREFPASERRCDMWRLKLNRKIHATRIIIVSEERSAKRHTHAPLPPSAEIRKIIRKLVPRSWSVECMSSFWFFTFSIDPSHDHARVRFQLSTQFSASKYLLITEQNGTKGHRVKVYYCTSY
jgi:hypothetical protein